jgi:hypothetical protein
MKKLLFFFFSLLLFNACKDKDKDKVPKDILPKEKMQEVLWSMITAGEFLNGSILSRDSVDRVAESSRVYGQVFQIHHVSREEFDKSYFYYREHPDLMQVILDSLTKKQTYTIGTSQKREDSMRGRIRKDSAIRKVLSDSAIK